MKVELISIGDRGRLRSGDRFLASRRDARILTRLKLAVYASSDDDVVETPPEKPTAPVLVTEAPVVVAEPEVVSEDPVVASEPEVVEPDPVAEAPRPRRQYRRRNTEE